MARTEIELIRDGKVVRSDLEILLLIRPSWIQMQ